MLKLIFGYVYSNHTGENRLVVSIRDPVVVWRTIDPNAPKGAKIQGSATSISFLRWAVAMRDSTEEDWNAFAEVERRRKWAREEGVLIRKFKLKRLKKSSSTAS